MHSLLRFCAMLTALAGVAACTTTSVNDATPQEAAAAAYRPKDAPKLTLLTVVNNKTGAGGHSALIVTGSEQVIFDPAGSFQHDEITRRWDVLYGVTPGWIVAYKSAHARSTYHVVTQEIPVTQAQVENALQLVRNNGAVPSAFCANATSSILRAVPGLEDISVTFYPVKLMDQVETIPGVKTERYYENDSGDVLDGIDPAAI